MERFFGVFGIIAILGTAFLLSNNRKAINYKIVVSGLLTQLILAVFILKVPAGQKLFQWLGDGITQLLNFSDKGAEFVFGGLVKKPLLDKAFGTGNDFIFAFRVAPTIIFVSALVSVSYHLGIMQRFISVVARIVHWIMGVSGAEALSNAASVFVGQVEAQILIKPYVPGMTMSELLASMAGSMACIAGGVMAVYIGMGIPAHYLLTASLMAAPGALVISKIIFPETQESETKGKISLEIKKTHVNLIDAIAHGASDGMRISINVIAMLVAFIAIIHMVDAIISYVGLVSSNIGLSLGFMGLDIKHLGLKDILGSVFSIFAWLMGVPGKEAHIVGSLLGTKFVMNEFVAYMDLAPMVQAHMLSPKAIAITTFALCGFANLGSVAMQVGGIGELAPSRRKDIAKLGLKALLCGTMASYLSATIAGILSSF